MSEWINVKDRMPEEHDSIFAKYYGTEKWQKNLFLKTSDECIVCVAFEDGSKLVTTSKTNDGKFRNPYDPTRAEVTHWMQLPESPKEEDGDE